MVCRWRSAHKQLALFSGTCHLFFKAGFTTPAGKADLKHKHIYHNKITTEHHGDTWFYHLRNSTVMQTQYSTDEILSCLL